MSDTDSFIDEVTEEVRRDKLFATMRKYAWLAVLVVLLIVGGAAYREWSLARSTAAAQAFGDAILGALDTENTEARISALSEITPPVQQGQAVLDMIIAAERVTSGSGAQGAETLRTLAANPEIPEIYRRIAAFKALSHPDSGLAADQRRLELEALAIPGNPLRLLAVEQLALIDIETGDRDAAQDKLRRILDDAEVTAGLRRRAAQVIVALGGSLDATQ